MANYLSSNFSIWKTKAEEKKYEDEYDESLFAEEFSDEYLDELNRPKKGNSRQTMLPLFVYFIMTREVPANTYISQADIIRRLAQFPYEMKVERKSLGRYIHTMCDQGLGIYCHKKYGVIYHPEKVWVFDEDYYSFDEVYYSEVA